MPSCNRSQSVTKTSLLIRIAWQFEVVFVECRAGLCAAYWASSEGDLSIIQVQECACHDVAEPTIASTDAELVKKRSSETVFDAIDTL